MILKSFQLGLECIFDEQKRVQFRNEGMVINYIYQRYFDTFKTEKCKKIIVHCLDELTSENISKILGFYTVQVKINTEEYFKLDNFNRKKLLLEYLWEGINKIVDDEGWDITPFLNAYNSVKEANYINEYQLKKRYVYSPNKKYKAMIIYRHDVDGFDMRVQVLDKKSNILYEEVFLKDMFNPFSTFNNLGSFHWLSNSKVELVKKNKDTIVINIPELI